MGVLVAVPLRKNNHSALGRFSREPTSEHRIIFRVWTMQRTGEGQYVSIWIQMIVVRTFVAKEPLALRGVQHRRRFALTPTQPFPAPLEGAAHARGTT